MSHAAKDIRTPDGAAHGVGSGEMVRCSWCGTHKRHFSEWEQRVLSTGEYQRLCRPCATRRLKNPWNALLDMRKIKAPNTEISNAGAKTK